MSRRLAVILPRWWFGSSGLSTLRAIRTAPSECAATPFYTASSRTQPRTAALGAAKQYVQPADDQSVSVIAGPSENDGEEHRLALCAAMVASLADHVAGRLNMPRSELSAWAVRWMEKPT